MTREQAEWMLVALCFVVLILPSRLAWWALIGGGTWLLLICLVLALKAAL